MRWHAPAKFEMHRSTTGYAATRRSPAPIERAAECRNSTMSFGSKSIGHSHFEAGLFGERSSPGARTYANDAGEHSRQVTLICEAAGQGYIRQRQSAVAQLILSYLDAMRQKPVMRCWSHGMAKRAREMTHRQTALPCYHLERHTTIEVGAENFLGAPHLPCRESTPDRR
jgi:hypothetical protein